MGAFSKIEVNNIIVNLDRNTASGHDNIIFMDLLNPKDDILRIIVEIIYEIFVSGTFPSELKTIRVSLVHKSSTKIYIKL